MIEHPLLTDIRAGSKKEPVQTWAHQTLTPEIRLYYKPLESDEDRIGFEFSVVEWTSGQGLRNFDGDLLADPEAEAEAEAEAQVLFCGIAYFDGVRHLYMGDEQSDNYGYLYYPDLKKIVLIMEALERLVTEHCMEG